MSCPNATSPIDISLPKITGKCDYKCAYSFNYNNSSCVATNRGGYISLSYDKSTSPPVLYNSSGYDVQEIRLYNPSLHSYAGQKTDAELVIVHTSKTGTKPLLVCIPVKSNNSTSQSALLFKNIIDTMSTNAPADGETTTVNVERFNLSNIVPRKPFFSYSATEPYQPCSENVDLIVFGLLDASLDITPDTLTKFQSFIMSNPYDIKTGPELFYNEKGPNQGTMGDEIYIDCQPVNASEENVEVITESGSTMTLKDFLNNPIVKIILGSLLFIIILYGIKYVLNLFKPVKETVANIMKGGKNIVHYKM